MSETLPDSGARTEYETGAVRDSSIGKGLPSNIPPIAIRRLAKRYEDGRAKYPDSDGPNWMKGIPLSHYQDSLMRHVLQAAEGDTTEDHLGAVLWNAAGWMWTLDAIERGVLPASLNDLPFRSREKKLDSETGSGAVWGEITGRLAPDVPYPEVPVGYHHWEPRGWGWYHQEPVRHAFIAADDDQFSHGETGTSGFKKYFYIEAVKGDINVGDRAKVVTTYAGSFESKVSSIAFIRGQSIYHFENGHNVQDSDLLSITRL